jgi:flagellar basal body-associated protein FliL
MRWILVTESPDIFAGMERTNGPKRGKSLLAALLVALVPVLCALVYQLYWEISEVAEHSDEHFPETN